MKVLLHSGGLDSHILWLMDRSRVPVFLDHGQDNAAYEFDALQRLAEYHQRDAVPFVARLYRIKSMKQFVDRQDFHMRHRNLMFILSVAQQWPEATEIAYAALAGEPSGDKSRAFVRAATRVLRESEGGKVRVAAPLLHLTKPQALRQLLKKQPQAVAALNLTRSCYAAASAPCGACQACYRRELAYWWAGLRPEPPVLPTMTHGPLFNMRRAGVRRWPALARANFPALVGVVKGWRK